MQPREQWLGQMGAHKEYYPRLLQALSTSSRKSKRLSFFGNGIIWNSFKHMIFILRWICEMEYHARGKCLLEDLSLHVNDFGD
jgi:hypothetical protein